MLFLALFLVWLKGIASGRFVDLALAHSVGNGKEPDATCKFKLDGSAGTRRDCMLACPNALAASVGYQVTDRWFVPHFSLLVQFQIRQWVAEVARPCASQPIWPCWVDTQVFLLLLHFQGYRKDLTVVPPDLVVQLRAAYGRGGVDDLWNAWSTGAESGLFPAFCRAGGPTAPSINAFLGRGRLRVRRRRLGVGLLVEPVPVRVVKGYPR